MPMFKVILSYDAPGGPFEPKFHIEADNELAAAAKARDVMRTQYPGEAADSRYVTHWVQPAPGAQSSRRLD